MSLIDANSYNFSSGDYCSTRKTRGQSYTAASIWGNCCNNNKTNNWQTWGLPLIFTIAGSVAQSIPNWCTPKNTDNVENKYQSEIKNTPNNETDKENVTKILAEANVEVSDEILEAVVLKYPTMKAIPSANLTIEQRVINYAKGLKASKALEDLSLKANANANSEEAIKLEEVQKALDNGSQEDFNNAYLQYAKEQIETYDTNNDAKIDLNEYIAEEKRNSGELFDEKATTAIFNTLDINNNNYLEQDEMAALTWATSKFNDTETSKSAFDITASEIDNVNTALATIGLRANLEEINKTATDEEMELLQQSIQKGTPAKVLLEQLLSNGYEGFHSYLQQQ